MHMLKSDKWLLKKVKKYIFLILSWKLTMFHLSDGCYLNNLVTFPIGGQNEKKFFRKEALKRYWKQNFSFFFQKQKPTTLKNNFTKGNSLENSQTAGNRKKLKKIQIIFPQKNILLKSLVTFWSQNAKKVGFFQYIRSLCYNFCSIKVNKC